MRIAVTGGSGKLGRQVVVSLLEAGHEVVNLDRVADPGPGTTLTHLGDGKRDLRRHLRGICGEGAQEVSATIPEDLRGQDAHTRDP